MRICLTEYAFGMNREVVMADNRVDVAVQVEEMADHFDFGSNSSHFELYESQIY